ncbi:MAG TPA: ATP-binding protein [Verrucomicrobiae bacterium]|nr:ATP-binding protein [Verrucomicrobiae bacterium]
MNRGIIFRLIAFFATIVLLAALIVWTAHTSWQRMGELQEHLSAQQWKSFEIADHLQQTVLGLNNLVLRYAAYDNLEDWTNFEETSLELSNWIDAQQISVSSSEERPLFQQIKVAFTNYMAAADAIHTRIYGSRQPIVRVEEFTDFQKQSKQILTLGFELAQVHQEALDLFQRQTTKSLDILRFTLLGSLVLLLAAGAWLAIVVYREMIAPLQVQLVESRRLVERQEKLASLGLLAAGVAHEIRNPLTAIKAWLYLQQKHLTPGSPEFADAKIIGDEISRLERIVRDFLQFARPSDPQFAVISAEQPLREAQTLMDPELAKSKIKLALEKIAPVQIRVDPQQIKQVLLNLIRNAAESIGENGTVTLRTRLDEKRLNDRQTDVVILEVSDTGKGISPEAEKRLFDPFFTTKDFGTGLGLPIAARIIERHHGALQYQTQIDRGTTFGIILPLHKP